LPLATPKADPKEIIRKGKTSQKYTSIVVPIFSDNLHNPPLSPEVVKWKERSLTLEDFPNPDFTTPPPIRFVVVTEGETSVSSSPSSLSHCD